MSPRVKKRLPIWHPRVWPTWVGLGVIWLIVHLPHRGQLAVGAGLGRLGLILARRRRHIVDVNLEQCFPDMTGPERSALRRHVFRSTGMGLTETARAWLRPAEAYSPRVTIEGAEHLRAAAARGKGVILLGMHLATLDLCGAALAREISFHVMYRPNKNPLIERIMTRGRARNFAGVVHREDMRGVLGCLKAGGILWYGPDQDYGPQHSIFAPFFGRDAATITATARIARITGSPVVVFSHYRSADERGYTVHLSPSLADFPTGDEVADATRINGLVEDAIRVAPAQYWWMHRRFKTPREGSKRLY